LHFYTADQKCRSFPKIPHLLQYVINGNYYRRIKVSGKIIREFLDTDLWAVSQESAHRFFEQKSERQAGFLLCQ